MWDLVQPHVVVLGFSINNHIVERSGVHFPRGTMRVRDATLMDQLLGGASVKIDFPEADAVPHSDTGTNG